MDVGGATFLSGDILRVKGVYLGDRLGIFQAGGGVSLQKAGVARIREGGIGEVFPSVVVLVREGGRVRRDKALIYGDERALETA